MGFIDLWFLSLLASAESLRNVDAKNILTGFQDLPAVGKEQKFPANDKNFLK